MTFPAAAKHFCCLLLEEEEEKYPLLLLKLKKHAAYWQQQKETEQPLQLGRRHFSLGLEVHSWGPKWGSSFSCCNRFSLFF